MKRGQMIWEKISWSVWPIVSNAIERFKAVKNFYLFRQPERDSLLSERNWEWGELEVQEQQGVINTESPEHTGWDWPYKET